jgi:hypothetical protein
MGLESRSGASHFVRPLTSENFRPRNDIPEEIKLKIHELVDIYNKYITSDDRSVFSLREFWDGNNGTNLKQILTYLRRIGDHSINEYDINMLNNITEEISIKIGTLRSRQGLGQEQQIRNEIRRLYFNAINLIKKFTDKDNSININNFCTLIESEAEKENQSLHYIMRRLYNIVSSLFIDS